jgi:hypothetical protein
LAGTTVFRVKMAVDPVKLVEVRGEPFSRRSIAVTPPAGAPFSVRVMLVTVAGTAPGLVNTIWAIGTNMSPARWVEIAGIPEPCVSIIVTGMAV